MDLCCSTITYPFERIPSIGNLHLSRIQTSLKKYPTFYSKAYHGQDSVLLTNIIMSWMLYFFSRNKECTCHIETHYIYYINFQGDKFTNYTKNKLVVLKKMAFSLPIHILQEHGKRNSTIFVFLRS